MIGIMVSTIATVQICKEIRDDSSSNSSLTSFSEFDSTTITLKDAIRDNLQTKWKQKLYNSQHGLYKNELESNGLNILPSREVRNEFPKLISKYLNNSIISVNNFIDDFNKK